MASEVDEEGNPRGDVAMARAMLTMAENQLASSEANGTVADATGNGLDAAPGGTDASQNVATNGVLGNGRVNCHGGIAYLTAQNTANLDLGDTFTVSLSGPASLTYLEAEVL